MVCDSGDVIVARAYKDAIRLSGADAVADAVTE
jgi:hypothetical protein